MQLHEQYRPSCWNEVIAQDKAVKIIETIKPRGLGGRAYWISGKSGTGKTTIARLLAAEIADDFGTVEIDAEGVTAKQIRDLEKSLRTKAIGSKGGRAIIINEGHGLRSDAVRQLLVTLERVPSHVCWVFTTTSEGMSLFEDDMDAHPLLSRCVEIGLSQRGLADAFADRVREIAEAEGLGGKDAKAYKRLANDLKSNMRAMLQLVETGGMVE